MPAIISPTTAGWPQRVKSRPTTAQTAMITKSCKKRRLKGLVPFCDKLDFTELSNDESGGPAGGETMWVGTEGIGRGSRLPTCRMKKMPRPTKLTISKYNRAVRFIL